MLNRNPSQNGQPAHHELADEELEQTSVKLSATSPSSGQASAKMKKLDAVRLALEAGRENTKEGVAW